MTGCRNRKRVQLYLDGWMSESETDSFESHLRSCPDCQAELVNVEEASSSALEIVDQAPDAKYWESFSSRLFNRLISRDVSPYESGRRRSKLRLRIGSYAVAVTTVAAAIMLLLNYAVRSPLDVDSPSGPDRPATVTDVSAEQAPPASAEDTGDIKAVGERSRDESAGGDSPVTVADERPNGVDGAPVAIAGEVVTADRVPDDAAIQTDVRFKTLFRQSIRQDPARLTLSEDNGVLSRLMEVYGDRRSDDYRLDQKTVVEAVLSGYGSWMDSGVGERRDGVSMNGSIPGVAGRSYPEFPEMLERDELARYMIELQLMRAK